MRFTMPILCVSAGSPVRGSAAESQRVPGAVRHLRPECRKPMEEHRLTDRFAGVL